MTRLVPLTPQVASSKFDEIAVYAAALSGTQIADHYAGASIDYLDDPQVSVGWEEVYGTDYPLSQTDVPVLSNGLCRIRYIPLNYAFALDSFTPGVGWQEQGRVTVYHDDSSGVTYTQQGLLQYPSVVEWTPERGVVMAVTSVTVSGVPYRMETYITLQRGWLGPRVECYPNPKTVAGVPVKLGAAIRYTAYSATAQVFASSSLSTDPWMSMLGATRATAMTWYRTTVSPTSFADSIAYAVSRPAIQVAAAQGSAAQGYVSARFACGAQPFFDEAENWKVVSGTVSQVADGTASAGQAVQQTATTGGTGGVITIPVVSQRFPPGKYLAYAKVRVVTGGDTGTVTWNSGATALGNVNFTSTTFVWVALPELIHLAGEIITFTMWRSAGTGNTRIDQIALIPVEGRSTGSNPAYGGARDLVQENLIDARYIPDLVAR